MWVRGEVYAHTQLECITSGGMYTPYFRTRTPYHQVVECIPPISEHIPLSQVIECITPISVHT